MKVWWGYGSEHSNNLKMIGTFSTVQKSQEVFSAFEEIREQAHLDFSNDILDYEKTRSKVSEAMKELLIKHNVYSLSPDDLIDFVLDSQVTLKAERIIVETDEIEVAGFLKLFYSYGGSIQVGHRSIFENGSE